MRIYTFIFIAFLFVNINYAEDSLKVSNTEFSGFLSGMQSVTKTPMLKFTGKDLLHESLIHNRLNFYWYPNDNCTATIQFRNRFIYGDNVKLNYITKYKDQIGKDNGYLPLTADISGGSYILTSTIDRLWVKLIFRDIEIVAGRQRINWGQTFAWNPNDIFNTYSYFDFDYEERQGSDAIRIQYYTGVASSAEIAFKIDSAENITAAGLYKLNAWNYDFQFLGGYYNSEDYVIGTGWSGSIWDFGFRGEISYFHPQKEFFDTSGAIFVSVGCEYIFNNSSMLSFEFFYSETFLDIRSGESFMFNTGSQSVKKLALSRYNYFGQFSYPITPLFNAGIGAMHLPSIYGGYIGPNVSYSLKENLEISLFAQIFNGKFPKFPLMYLTRQNINMGYLRLKWNF